jgi:hypothetical protein
MLLGNDQDVYRRPWIDVMKSEHVLVFVNFPARDLAAHDATEYAFRHVISHNVQQAHLVSLTG